MVAILPPPPSGDMCAAVVPPALPADRISRNARSYRVLLVDDNEDAVLMLAKLLRHHGYDTRSCTSGTEALAVGAEFEPHAVILDLGMPGMDGIETATRLKAEAWGSPVLLVALSGWGRDDDLRRTAEAGFDQHLVKPLEIDRLLEVLGTGVPRN